MHYIIARPIPRRINFLYQKCDIEVVLCCNTYSTVSPIDALNTESEARAPLNLIDRHERFSKVRRIHQQELSCNRRRLLFLLGLSARVLTLVNVPPPLDHPLSADRGSSL
jgi:hypothetical protein